MTRVWTCGGCGRRWPRIKQRCECGRKRPRTRPPKHRAILDTLTYEQAVELVGEECGICGAKPKNKRLQRDHDHKTGKFRGLLCFRCNTGLRNYMTAAWINGAAAYLARAEEREEKR